MKIPEFTQNEFSKASEGESRVLNYSISVLNLLEPEFYI